MRGCRGGGMHWRGDKVREARLRWSGGGGEIIDMRAEGCSRRSCQARGKEEGQRGGLRMWRGIGVGDMIKIFQSQFMKR